MVYCTCVSILDLYAGENLTELSSACQHYKIIVRTFFVCKLLEGSVGHITHNV